MKSCAISKQLRADGAETVRKMKELEKRVQAIREQTKKTGDKPS